ncbi:MAG: tetratricopeptide repeat protein [Candidatus Omnitrophica bacterium]|nr:tetratricopeptide repeat protein [Candidatus Omnitrophota bacterium]
MGGFCGKAVFIVYTLSVLFLSGCASTSAFKSYPSQIDPLIQDIRADRNIDLSRTLANKVKCGDKILYLMERGRIAQIQGDYGLSRKNFEMAMQAVEESDGKALISATGAAAQASSVIVNDNTIPYRPAGYERVMLYHLQAMNYLAQGDPEGAGVEARRAGAEQDDALAQHEKEVARAQEQADKKKLPLEGAVSQVDNVYSSMDAAIGRVKNSFQNAYAFYLSGLVYEMLGRPNDAYIDYKKAIEICPDNRYLRRDLVRLAERLKMNDDLARYRSLYPDSFRPGAPARSGECVVFFDDDFVARKKEVKIPVPVSFETLNFISIAFPIYTIPPFNPRPLVISESGKELGESEPLVDIDALALKALKEKVPSLVVHQLLRASAKTVMAKAAEDQGGWVGSLVASAYNIISESADLRSWLTLPGDAQVARFRLSPGEHDIVFSPRDNPQVSAAVSVNIPEDGIAVIYVVSAGERLYCRVFPVRAPEERK